MRWIMSLLAMMVSSCTTSYHEITGTCIVQEWSLSSVVLRQRQICELPPPDANDVQLRDREPMNINPFPDLFETNEADSTDPNLLEKARLRKLWHETDDPATKAEIYKEYEKLEK